MFGCVELNFERKLIVTLFKIVMKLEIFLMFINMGMFKNDVLIIL